MTNITILIFNKQKLAKSKSNRVQISILTFLSILRSGHLGHKTTTRLWSGFPTKGNASCWTRWLKDGQIKPQKDHIGKISSLTDVVQPVGACKYIAQVFLTIISFTYILNWFAQVFSRTNLSISFNTFFMIENLETTKIAGGAAEGTGPSVGSSLCLQVCPLSHIFHLIDTKGASLDLFGFIHFSKESHSHTY